MEQKMIAWGASKLLKMFLRETVRNPFTYCIDDFSKEAAIRDIPIVRSAALADERPGNFQIVIFAVSSNALQEISRSLGSRGLRYGTDYIFYSDFFYKDFLRKARKGLGFAFDPKIYQYALSFTLNSRTPVHTTILGTWLLLELLGKLDRRQGHIAEVGAFQGGNALCSLQFMSRLQRKKYYLFDSFEGFPELTKFDPATFSSGDYAIGTGFQEIADTFAVFPNARVIKGFVPDTFRHIPKREKFSCVFYDCDLYQPALDTYAFFWDRIVPGGYLVIHDYEAEEGGFTGVRKATDEFFGPRKVALCSFIENTMAVIKKR